MSDTIADHSEILPISIEQEMKTSYLDYAMSVIVSRAIPDVCDGLKPVHRRILYAMAESGCDFNKPYRKSARIVGEVMGKYHPHGDSAIYDALVRMAQDFSMRLMLVDGQGNFGSMDGDKAAAMRYTESRLAKAAHALLGDIDKNTISFQDNYDGSEKEPMVLPAQDPNLLVNGAGGIAVGMATNIPTHNLGEVIDACCMYLDNRDVTIEELMEVIPGPDFPTGGIIMGRSGIHSAFSTGRGSVVIRAKTRIENISGGREAIIIEEIPYQVNKSRMIEQIADLVRDKRVEGISDLRDESDGEGVRVVIETKKDAQADVILNQLFKFTPLQTSFGVNMLALNRGRPQLLALKDVIVAFIDFREEVITRRTAFLLGKSRDRAHVLIGLAMAVANIDEVIKVIRHSADPVIAKEELMAREWNAGDVLPLINLVEDSGNLVVAGKCRFTEAQAKAVLELRLQRLTGLEREKIDGELNGLADEIKEYLSILASREKLLGILRAELLTMKTEFATPRRTEIQESEYDEDVEDLIAREDMVVTVTMGGYIKRVPLATYRAQRRGGKGRSAMSMREEDITTELFVANTHTPVLFFSNKGKVYRLKVYKLPIGSPQSRGKALVNVFPLEAGETITTFMPLPEEENLWDQLNVIFSTAKGNIRRNDLSDFHSIRANGKIAIRMDEDDRLVGVSTCTEDDHILLAARSGKCIRFPVHKVRVFKSRTSDGVRGMKLAEDDKVISMTILRGADIDIEERMAYLKHANAARRGEKAEVGLSDDRLREIAQNEEFILTITENGYGKRTSAYEYRVTNRGGSGIVNIETSERNGQVVASFPVEDKNDIILMTDQAKVIRCPVRDIRIAGRNTQGVTIFNTSDKEVVVSATRIVDEGGEGVEGLEGAEGGEALTDAADTALQEPGNE
ncbi:MAG: DNA gyrase subunit A [Alphaproteobacteria bacterium]|nr:DNA gyrase subunit A [Alphaproteobacteria bacterium]